MKAAAFTLVELLVVVVILLALIAIALPVANLVKSRGLVSGCASNLSQIGKAVLMYADDHQGWLPCHSVQAVKGPDDKGRMETKVIGRPNEWRDSLNPDTKSYEVFWCPADRNRGKLFLALNDHPEDVRQLYTSYQMGVLAFLSRHWHANGALAIRLTKLKRGPGETPYVGDAQWMAGTAQSWMTSHGRGGNALYLDGSVRYTRAE